MVLDIHSQKFGWIVRRKTIVGLRWCFITRLEFVDDGKRGSEKEDAGKDNLSQE